MNILAPAFRALALACGLFALSLAPCRAQSIDRIVPRHPDAIELPELGRMTCERCGFGRELFALGDINNDSLFDFAATKLISDTGGWGAMAKELRLYKGVRGGLPDIGTYQRIGPTEIGVDVNFMAVGDWDGDGSLDIATKLTPIKKDTAVNPNEYGVSSMVIWWGNTQGVYSLEDTTQLEVSADAWLGPQRGYTMDFDRDSVDDLLLMGVKGFQAGEVRRDMPETQIFFGGQRWGSIWGRRMDWGWWSKPVGELSFLDQDVDGLTDLIFYHNVDSPPENGAVRIIYGKEGIIIDTSNIVTIDLTPATGKYALLADISGDKVPELLVNTGGEETLKAYIGLKGRRIAEQFGSGDEPSHPGEEVWWGKPWAAIPLPAKLHDGWAASGWSDIYDFGDGGLDGVGDVWVTTVPDIVFYNGGNKFDSLYDGWINIPCGGGSGGFLGDIDGSGKPTIAIGYQCDQTSGIKFVQPSNRVPTGGKFRQLPPGTDTPVSGVPSGQWGGERSLDVQAIPNPTSGEVRILWRGDDKKRKNGDATIAVHDMLGQPVRTFSVPDHQGETVWDASKTFDGAYFITVTVGEASETTRIVIQR